MGTTTVAALLRLSALQSCDWATTLEQILRVDSETLGVDRVSYWTTRRDPPRFFCELGYESAGDVFERGTVLEQRRSPAYFDAVRELEIIDVVDVENDPRTAELRPYITERRVRSLLDVPIWVGGEPVGVLCHESLQTRRWTKADREFALAVAHVLVAALQTRERTRAEFAERRSVFLNQAATALTNTLDQERIERAAVTQAVPMLGDIAMLDLLDDEALERVAVAHDDAADEAYEIENEPRLRPRMDRTQLSSQAVRLQSTVFVPVVSRALTRGELDPDYARCLLDVEIQSAVAVPFKLGRRPGGALTFCTTKRRLEQSDVRLAEEYVELVSAALENARLYARARRAIRSRDEFMSLASHELRTPLTSLRASAEALASGLVDPSEVEPVARSVVRQVDRLDRLAQRILDTVEIDAGALQLHREHLDLSELVRNVADEHADGIERADCTVEVDAPSPVEGDWDPGRLRTVIGNLVENAIKFGKGRPIVIRVVGHADEAEISVIDRGGSDGFPDEESSAFERYGRGRPARGRGGLGLGLYVVRELVRAHDGEVHVIRRPDAGTTITVELPYGDRERWSEGRDAEATRPHRG